MNRSSKSQLKQVCQKFEVTSGFRIAVNERAGDSVRGCGREDCLWCAKSGQCEKNSKGTEFSARSASRLAESGMNAYSRGLEHQADLRNKDNAQ